MSLQADMLFADPSSMQTSLCSSLPKILRLFITVFFMGTGECSVTFEAGLTNLTLRTLPGLIVPVQLGTQKSMGPFSGGPSKGKALLL